MTKPMRYRWYTASGDVLSCNEKISVLEENMTELEQICQEILDDALLMGCSSDSAKAALHELIDKITPNVKERA